MYFTSNNRLNKRVWLSFGRVLLLTFAIFCLLFTPAFTHAGFFTWLVGQDAIAETETVIQSSSQDMSLLESDNNYNQTLLASTALAFDGGEALLPEAGPSSDAPEVIDNSNGQISIYTVRSGDTLAGVAEMFDVTVNTILWSNDMTRGSTLKVGQKLVILPISGVMHTIVSGDTLQSIAKKYGGDINEMAGFNDLKITDKLVIGNTIMIPDGQVSSSIRPSSGVTSRVITSAGCPSYDGYYIKPFVGGRRTQGLHGYNGVDFGMPVGSSIFASAAGTVLISKNSGWNGGYGNYSVVKHFNGTQTIYAHLSSTLVTVGQTVSQGQLIGYSGNTGKSTGPHLHFEIRGAKNPF